MEEGLIKMRCGQCGNEKHTLYLRTNGEVVVECPECKSTSQIVISQPRIKIENNSGWGTICPFI